MGFCAAQGRLSPAFCFVQTATFIKEEKEEEVEEEEAEEEDQHWNNSKGIQDAKG